MTIVRIVKPFADASPVNHVRVEGIEGVKTKLSSPRQVLADVDVTTGYFTYDENIKVYWTDDRTQLAENVKLVTLQSVNGGLSGLGGGEEHDDILGESTVLAIGSILTIHTGYAAYIIIFLAIVYIILAVIPDTVLTYMTIPVGRIVQAIALSAILWLMTKIGHGVYQFTGNPVEYLYRELVGIAEIDGTLTEDLVELTIENHLVQTQAQADAAALLNLFRQQARGNPRRVEALHDLRLEADDIFEIPDGRRFLIDSITRTLTRTPGQVLANYATYEVTPGVSP